MSRPKYHTIALIEEPRKGSKSFYYQIFDYLDGTIGTEVRPFQLTAVAIAREFEMSQQSAFTLLVEMGKEGYLALT